MNFTLWDEDDINIVSPPQEDSNKTKKTKQRATGSSKPVVEEPASLGESLWGQDFDQATEDSINAVLNKINKHKQPKVLTEKSIKSKSVSIEDKLMLIKTNVDRILGVYKENTVVIKTKKQLTDYFDAAISNGIIAVDTETNNSLDPISCKLMGPCIYTPGQKNAYIPINHVNYQTGEKLDWQLTEQDMKEQFQRLIDNNIKILFHNAKFDYEVIYCTCDIKLPIYWDTLLGAKILNENERAGLKEQYITKIDPSIEKYSIEHLFEGIEYAVVDPDIFALYAATDAFMTYKLYEWQKKQFEFPDSKKLYYVFKEIEVPVIEVTASMELAGVCLDVEYSKRLSVKYHKRAEAIDKQIEEELKKYDDVIAKWRLTPEANEHPIKNDKEAKSKNEQLETPVSITSPVQLAILLYDVLKMPCIDKKTPRGTGEEFMSTFAKDYNMPLCQLILDKRGLEKLIGTYIDKLPECINPVDNRLHAHFNQYGADTGRFSSSDPNLQNIPSHEKSIRMMFTAATKEHIVEENDDNIYIVPYTDEVLTTNGWIKVKNLVVGNIICGDDSQDIIKDIKIDDEKNYLLYV